MDADKETVQEWVKETMELLREESSEKDTRRPRFDGTINLGHIMTAVVMLLGAFGMWTSFRINQADQESRLKSLEQANIEMHQTLKNLSESQTQQQITQKEISMSLKYLTDQVAKH